MQETLGRLQEAVERMSKDIDELKGMIRDTSHKIDELREFKWRVAGGAALLTVVVTALIQALHFLSRA